MHDALPHLSVRDTAEICDEHDTAEICEICPLKLKFVTSNAAVTLGLFAPLCA